MECVTKPSYFFPNYLAGVLERKKLKNHTCKKFSKNGTLKCVLHSILNSWYVMKGFSG